MQSTSFAFAQRIAQKFAESNMTAEVTIVRPGPTTLDTVDGSLDVATGVTVYTGAARVYPVGGPVTLDLGDEPQYFSSAYVSVPLTDASGANVLPQVDDLVEIVDHPDPLAVGRLFRVTDVEAGGQLAVVRRMQVVGVQRFKAWEPDDQAETTHVPKEWLL